MLNTFEQLRRTRSMGVRYRDNKELESMNKRGSAARPKSPGGHRGAASSLEVLP